MFIRRVVLDENPTPNTTGGRLQWELKDKNWQKGIRRPVKKKNSTKGDIQNASSVGEV